MDKFGLAEKVEFGQKEQPFVLVGRKRRREEREKEEEERGKGGEGGGGGGSGGRGLFSTYSKVQALIG